MLGGVDGERCLFVLSLNVSCAGAEPAHVRICEFFFFLSSLVGMGRHWTKLGRARGIHAMVIVPGAPFYVIQGWEEISCEWLVRYFSRHESTLWIQWKGLRGGGLFSGKSGFSLGRVGLFIAFLIWEGRGGFVSWTGVDPAVKHLVGRVVSSPTPVARNAAGL